MHLRKRLIAAVAAAIGVAVQAQPQDKPAADEKGSMQFVLAIDGLPQKGEWRGKPSVGDLNEDGHLDIVASIRKGDSLHIFLGDGKGKFKNCKPDVFNRFMEYGASAIADVNKDGHQDIVFTTHGSPLQVFLGDGKTGFKTSGGGIRHPDILEGAVIGDVNEDGNLDIIGLGWSSGGFFEFLSDGKGGWKTETPISTRENYDYGHEVLLADVKGDGHLDIVATYGGAAIFAGDGKGHFSPWGKGLPAPDTWGICTGVDVADINGDGKLDVAVTFAPAIDGMLGVATYLQGADGTFTLANQGLPTDLSFNAVRMGDLDGDGHIDLVAQGGPERKPAVYVWRGDGKGTWTQAVILRAPGDNSQIVLADFNEDKRLDILEVCKDSPGGVRVWLNRPSEPTR